MLSDVGGSGLRGPERLAVAMRLPEHPHVEVSVDVALSRGAYAATSVTVASADPDEPVTTELLREIPLRTIVRRAVSRMLRSLNVGQIVAPDGDRGDAEAAALRNVAQVYRIARLTGEAPTKAVQERLGVSRATASRRVAEARAAGFLRADEVGSAGGAPARMGG